MVVAMRLLFTSDVHGYGTAFRQFADLLRKDDYDCGVVAGDNNPDALSRDEIKARLGLTDDDLIEELPSPDDDVDSYIQKADIVHYLDDALQAVTDETLEILSGAGKPVFVIAGNHDTSVWKDQGRVRVLNDGRRVRFAGRSFVGYQKTTLDTDREVLEREFLRLGRHVGNKTILITHTPAHGILDTVAHRGYQEGSPALRRVVDRRKPLLHLFGHIHESAGHQSNAVNGSFMRSRKFFSIDTCSLRVETVPYVDVPAAGDKSLDYGGVIIPAWRAHDRHGITVTHGTDSRSASPPSCESINADRTEGSDGGNVLELEDIETLEARERHLRIKADMEATGSWYMKGQKIEDPKYLALGRSSYYVAFMARLSKQLGTPVYQSDFMDWIDPAHPDVSLLYFIKTAERIDISLEGITPEQLRAATSDASGAAENRSQTRFPYMTSWEMNQVYHGGFLNKAYWHTSNGAMSKADASRALGTVVPVERIFSD